MMGVSQLKVGFNYVPSQFFGKEQDTGLKEAIDHTTNGGERLVPSANYCSSCFGMFMFIYSPEKFISIVCHTHRN